jgi:hypothetical protein
MSFFTTQLAYLPSSKRSRIRQSDLDFKLSRTQNFNQKELNFQGIWREEGKDYGMKK